MSVTPVHRTCPICNAPVTGRLDKKYCSDQCRHLANNKHKLESQQNLIDSNRVLRRNRTILKKLCPEGKATVRRSVLTDLGFNPSYFTSLFITEKKQVYYLSYDYGFTPIIDKGVQKALIIRRQDYMGSLDPWKFVKPRESDG